jgi:mono/diheme cytochrome c family protein
VKILLSVICTLAGLVLIGLIVMYSGMINVSAMNEPSGFTKWVLSSTMERSIESRSEDIKVPELQNETMIHEGAEHYVEMCQGCHGAPGMEDTEMAQGLEPKAPLLYEMEDSGDFDPAEAFWIVKNGIMMTSMPAWGVTHSDEKIWDIVAFLKKLPEMTPEEYGNLAGTVNAESMGEHEHNEAMEDAHMEH